MGGFFNGLSSRAVAHLDREMNQEGPITWRNSKVLWWTLSHPRRLMNYARLWLGRRSLDDRLSYLPAVIDIEPTIRCNLRCRMCQTTTWKRRCDDLSMDRFRHILDEIPTLAKIKLQGMGEPLLNKHLFEMVEEAHDRKVAVETITNGTLFTEEVCERLVRACPEMIYVSIDGATPGTHEAIRGGSKLANVHDGVRRLLQARGASKFPIVAVWTVGQRENLPELSEMVRQFADMKLDLMTFSLDMTCWGKESWREQVDAERLFAESLEVKETTARAAEVARQSGLHFRVHHAYGYSYSDGHDCPWPWYSCFISADGYVMPCCFIGDPEVASFGNVFKESFADIWNGEAYRRFRRQIAGGRIPGYCRMCYGLK